MRSTKAEVCEWEKSIKRELEILIETETLELIDESRPVITVLPSFIVLNRKRYADISVERFKARIVAGGHVQKKGSYTYKSVPVVEFSVVRFFLRYSVTNGMKVIQIDIKCAFPNGEIHEEIYIRLPKQLTSPYGGALFAF